MQFYALLMLVMAGRIFAHLETPMCQSTVSRTQTSCTLTFTPWMEQQVGPTSTVYDEIVTTWFNCVDCRYCTVTNVDANPSPEGPFYAKTTSSVLTVWRVGCMPMTTAVTRRDFRGYPTPAAINLRSIEVVEPHVAEFNQPRHLEAHALESRPAFLHLRRSIQLVTARNLKSRSFQEAANNLAKEIDPDNALLSQKAYQFLIQLNGALFSINLINSGFNLTNICQECRDPAVQLHLTAASLDAKQVGDIVCFASVYGFSVNTTNFDLLSKLEAAIYAVQVSSNFTTNRTELCTYVQLPFGPYLGIDSNEITDYICGINSNRTTSSWTSEATTTPPMITGTTGTGASDGSAPTQEPGPYTNTTASVGTAISAGTTGTADTGQLTSSDTWSVEFPNATYSANAAHVPPSPTTPFYFSDWTTSTKSSAEFKMQ